MTQSAPFFSIPGCRSCGSADLHTLIAFGETPLADRLMRPDDETEEYIAPLTLVVCENCGLCQIRETVDPAILFGADYPYYSSVSPALMAHFHASARQIMQDRDLNRDSLVIEAASNDGYMLSAFAEAGIPVLGIDPAEGPAQQARSRGIDTRIDFFSAALARDLAAEGQQADVFLANNVLAHVAETNDFVAGIAMLLKPDGVAVLEFPYLGDLIARRAFDTIYHQHLLYLSAQSAADLFARAGLHLNDAERLKIHGGSLRITASRHPGQSDRLKALLEDEAHTGMATPAYFDAFLADLDAMQRETRAALEALLADGKRIAGYGAAAKSTTLLHHLGIDRRHLDYIVDKSTWKQGLEMPGVRIPIAAPDKLASDRPDTVLILAWNFAREIMAENRAFTDAGGTFLVPVPRLRTVQPEDLEASL